MFRLDDKGVVVVGAASGIGEAVAHAVAEQGGRLGLVDVNEESLARVAAEVESKGSKPVVRGVDIRDGASLDGAFASLANELGGLHGVVCTPSINVRKRILEYSDDELDRVVDLNLKGSFHVLQSSGRIMARQKGGSIVVFSSIRSVVVEPGQAVYAATKAGIVQMVRTLAAELGELGVRVNAVAPGVVETPLTKPIRDTPEWHQAYADKNVLKRWAHPEEMAGPTVFLLSEAASYVTGTVLFVDGGWTAADGRFTPP